MYANAHKCTEGLGKRIYIYEYKFVHPTTEQKGKKRNTRNSNNNADNNISATQQTAALIEREQPCFQFY